MYFPTLDIMRNYQIDDFITHKLDVWLGTRRRATWKFLSPYQFSLDSGIDETTSINIFVVCTEKNISVLKQRYVVECRCCDSILGSFELPSKIPDTIYCLECDKDIPVTKELVTIWFELIKQPERQEFDYLATTIIQSDRFSSGKI